MATQELQISQITTGSPVVRRTTEILAVAAALTVGAVIGRETATTSDAGTTVRPAAPIALTGWETADAAARAARYEAVTAPSAPFSVNGWETADAAARAARYEAVTAGDGAP
jgi:hypothetical protein